MALTGTALKSCLHSGCPPCILCYDQGDFAKTQISSCNSLTISIAIVCPQVPTPPQCLSSGLILVLYLKVTGLDPQAGLCSHFHSDFIRCPSHCSGPDLPSPLLFGWEVPFIFQVFRSSLKGTSSKSPSSELAVLSKFSLYSCSYVILQ